MSNAAVLTNPKQIGAVKLNLTIIFGRMIRI